MSSDVPPTFEQTPSMNKYKRTCENCTVAKVKCEGHPICTRCSKRNLQCLFRKQRKRGRKSQYPLPRVGSPQASQYGAMMVPAQAIPGQPPQTPPAGWPGPNPQAFLGMSSVSAVQPNFNSSMMPIVPQYTQHATSPHLHNISSVSSLNVPGLVQSASPATAGPIYGYPPTPNQQNRVWLMPPQQQQQASPAQPQATPPPHPHAQHVQSHMHYPMMVRPQGIAHTPGSIPPDYGFSQQERRAESAKARVTKAVPLPAWQRRRIEAVIGVNAAELKALSVVKAKKSMPPAELLRLEKAVARVASLLQAHGSTEANSFVQAWARSAMGGVVEAAGRGRSPVELSVGTAAVLRTKLDDTQLRAMGLSANWNTDIPALFVSFAKEGENVTGLELQGNPAFHSAFVPATKLQSEMMLDWGADALAGIFNEGRDLVQFVATANMKLKLGEAGKDVSFVCMHLAECLWRSDPNVPPAPLQTLVRCAFVKHATEGSKCRIEMIASFERVDLDMARSAKRSKIVPRQKSDGGENSAETSAGKDEPTKTDIQWIKHLFQTQLNYTATQNVSSSGQTR